MPVRLRTLHLFVGSCELEQAFLPVQLDRGFQPSPVGESYQTLRATFRLHNTRQGLDHSSEPLGVTNRSLAGPDKVSQAGLEVEKTASADRHRPFVTSQQG